MIDYTIISAGTWLVCAGTCAVIADGKGRNAFGWFLLGGMFSLFALVAVCALPRRKAETASTSLSPEPLRTPSEIQITKEIARGETQAALWAHQLNRGPYGKSWKAG